ncbi:MAG: helix-turn-helix domain-containing protein [Sphingopyxis sp.]|uniref:MmyB family transcriptional regulator n=1 Tax=Sphingopyxis sp. TaxID=1908224 RepID=UPI0032EF06A6
MTSRLGPMLKAIRERSGIAQLELSLRMNVSQRHVSFVESGRSRPSRDLIEAWLCETEAPPSLRNAVLLAAGYAPASPDVSPGDPRLGQAIAALDRTLDLHEPFPGLVFDADWQAHLTNCSARRLMRLNLPDFVADIDDLALGFSMIDALIHPGGLFCYMRDPWIGGGALLDQLRREQWVRPALEPRADRVEASMIQRFGPRPAQAAAPSADPYLNLVFDTPRGVMRFFTIQSVFALPQDVTLASLRMELWFPADEPTRAAMKRLAGDDAGPSAGPIDAGR